MQLHTSDVKTVLKTVDVRSLLKKETPKAARACDGADALDGLAVLIPTTQLIAAVFGISRTSINRARRLTPEQRDAVRRKERPLCLPRKASPQEQLSQIVDEIGLDRVQNLLWAFEVTHSVPAPRGAS
jgi:hypothetical protein